MAWAAALSSTALTLTGSLGIVQKDAADWEIGLNPRETAHLQFEFNPQGTPTEDCKVVIESSHDGGTTWDTEPYYELVIDNGIDPNIVGMSITGIHTFRIKATVLDTDGTAGGDDTTSTLTVHARLDGVSA